MSFDLAGIFAFLENFHKPPGGLCLAAKRLIIF